MPDPAAIGADLGLAPSEAAGVAPRDAIVWLPGLFRGPRGQGADAIARRLARALDHHAKKGTARFLLEETKDEDYKDAHRSRVVTLVRLDGDVKTVVADVYELAYDAVLTGAFRERKPIFQALEIGLVLLRNAARVAGAVRRPAKSAAEKLQIAWGGLLFLLLMAYIPVVLAGTTAVAWKTGEDFLAPPAGEDAGVEPDRANVDAGASGVPSPEPIPWDGPLRAVELVVLLAASLGLFTRKSIKETLAEVAANAVPAAGYLDLDERRGLVRGQLSNLLEHLVEKADAGVTYRRVHVVGYSFGSLVALDALFPYDAPGPRLSLVDTLVTIGSPFDFLRTYWPGYFTGRKRRDGTPRRWINVYSPLDVLGSDFRDVRGERRLRGVELAGGGERTPDENLRYGRERTLSFARPFELLGLVGFRMHTGYWDEETWGTDCFDLVVERLYGDEPIQS